MFPTLHNAKPAEDLFSGLFILETHNGLLLAVHGHDRADLLDLLVKCLLNVTLDVLLGGIPVDKELDLVLVLQLHHRLFCDKRVL